MINNHSKRGKRLGTALAALALGFSSTAVAAQRSGPPKVAGTYRPTQQIQLSTGQGQMIRLPRNVADVWVSNPGVADVYISSPSQINLFGKEFGEATVIATAADGSVVYGANVRVSQNLPSINEVLKVAMPDSNIQVVTVGQLAVLTGTVGSPQDSAFATQLVTSELNPGVDLSKEGATCKICVLNRLKSATPLQVMLKVRIAEVNRSLVKSIGVNLLTGDRTSGFQGGVLQGQGIYLPPPDDKDPSPPSVIRSILGSTLSASGKVFGLDVLATLDLAETDGLVNTLAEPSLTALSGETASFLAGGEFPIPVSQGNGAVTIEYKQYGVGLAFTPVVLADGRISMRVRPEVSELSNEGSIRLNGFNVPAVTTRRAETTVELGSGQSFMLAGLLRNVTANDVNKAPFLGDLPIIGALFKSSGYRRSQTELVIIVTPYLVRPVSGQLAAPTDGFRSPNDAGRVFGGALYNGVNGPSPAAGRALPAPGMSVPMTVGGAATVSAPATVAATPGFKL